MKRTSARIGFGLLFASTCVGACFTEGDTGPIPTQGVSQPRAATPVASQARDVVFAVRGQIERAFRPTGTTSFGASRAAPQSLELFHAASAEQLNALAPNNLVASPKLKTSVLLASRADGAFRVTDEQSRLSVDVSLRGATNSIREDVDGYSVYRSAYAHGAHVMHRTSVQGTEDYVFFPDEVPATPELRYDIALSDDVAGLRLVSNTLELLDKTGTPRLRMNPPYAVDGDGQKVGVHVAIEGCVYDSSGVMPWGRPTIDPGARQCTVHLTWDGSAKAPLVVDPAWIYTANEITPRLNMSATVVGNKVVVAGGDIGGDAGSVTVFDTVEYYDVDTMTWAVGPNMPSPRTDHAAALLQVNNNPYLYVMGGRTSNTTITDEVVKLDLNGGTWLTGLKMPSGVAKPTSTLLADGRVLLAGGLTGTPSSPTNIAMVYDPANTNWSQSNFGEARVGHTATLVQDQYVLIAGGRSTGGLASFIELFETVGSTWVKLNNSLAQKRVRHTATRLKDNRVMFVGGEADGDMPIASVEICNLNVGTRLCAWASSAPALPGPRSRHGAVYLEALNSVVVLGGRSASDPMTPLLGTVERWAPGLQWQPLPELQEPRMDFQTVMPVQGHVMAIGGVVGAMAEVTGSVELLACMKDDDCTVGGSEAYCSRGHVCRPKKANGETCDLRAAADQGVDCLEKDCPVCESTFCVDGYCCNSKCDDQCAACDSDAPGDELGKCTPIVGPPHGDRGACGVGTTPDDDELCGGKCDGTNVKECAFPKDEPCASTCDVTTNTWTSKVCDGKGDCGCPEGGNCTAETLTPCGPYACDSNGIECTTICDPKATPGTATGCDDATAVCNMAMQCVPTPTQCDQDTNEMILANGERLPCGNFQCVAGACLTVCDTAYNCRLDKDGVPLYVCDESRRCVSFTEADTTESPDISCAASSSTNSSRYGWLAALALAGAFAARRNRARA